MQVSGDRCVNQQLGGVFLEADLRFVTTENAATTQQCNHRTLWSESTRRWLLVRGSFG